MKTRNQLLAAINVAKINARYDDQQAAAAESSGNGSRAARYKIRAAAERVTVARLARQLENALEG